MDGTIGVGVITPLGGKGGDKGKKWRILEIPFLCPPWWLGFFGPWETKPKGGFGVWTQFSKITCQTPVVFGSNIEGPAPFSTNLGLYRDMGG